MKNNGAFLNGNFLHFVLQMFALLLLSSAAAQYNLGATTSFYSKITTSSSDPHAKSIASLFNARVSITEIVTLEITHQKRENDLCVYTSGTVQGGRGTFFIRASEKWLSGHILLLKENKAFEYYSENGNAFVRPTDVHNVMCIEYNIHESVATTTPVPTFQITEAAGHLQSLPGARGCIYLDFDGEYVEGTAWGRTIDAEPSGMTEAAIHEAWELVSEDFRPFHLNITTDEHVFESYPKNMRMRVIFTPTNEITWMPNGGVAYLGSFGWADDTPCWVYIMTAKEGGEAASHEIGHTLGLRHDGRTAPAEEYYYGHGDWAPIMGSSYHAGIGQWSKGEYTNASNNEDDLAILSGITNGVGYRDDDHSNSRLAATVLQINKNGSVSALHNSGIIETSDDLDFFSIQAAAGILELDVTAASPHSNLDIQLVLYDASGTMIGTYNPASLNSALSVTVSSGTYYVSVSGTGNGDPATDGYSEYASLGSYSISGIVPKSITASPEKLNVLFIGNSYTYANNLPEIIRQLALSSGNELTYSASTPGGYTLENHYSNAATLKLIEQGGWDYVVVQEQSQLPSFSDAQVQAQVYPYAKKLDSLIKISNPCAKTVFYMTWGRKNGDASVCPALPWVCTYEGMDDALQLRYTNMADSNNAVLCPVAKVWRSLREHHPAIELYDGDGSHPSAKGSFATACAFYSVFFKKDPVLTSYLYSLTAADASILKTVSKEIVFDNLTRWYSSLPSTPEISADFSYTVTSDEISFQNSSLHANALKWNFGDGIVSEEENPVHTYTTPGMYQVTLIAQKCDAADTIIKAVSVLPTGIKAKEEENEIVLYPNPAHNFLYLNTSGSVTELIITDVSGRTVLVSTFSSEARMEVNIRNLENGVYFVTIHNGSKIHHTSFVKRE